MKKAKQAPKNRANPSATNPSHKIDASVRKALDKLFDLGTRRSEIIDRLAVAARPTPDERAERAKLIGNASQDRPKGGDRLMDMSKSAMKRVVSVAETIGKGFPEYTPPTPPPPPVVPGVDSHFHWSHTQARNPSSIQAGFNEYGLNFQAWLSHDSQELTKYTFGASAYFVIQSHRLPASSNGRWLSAPVAGVHGALDAYAGEGDWWDGDCWSKCWMHVRQTLLQHTVGGMVPIATGHRVEQLVFLENTHSNQFVLLPGSVAVPPLVFAPVPFNDVISHIEIEFHVQLEGVSFLNFCPPTGGITLQFPQWPAQVA